MTNSFKSHEPKRLVGLITGAGEITSAAWPVPNRSIVSKKTREHEQRVVKKHNFTSHPSLGGNSWRKIAINRIGIAHDGGTFEHTSRYAIY